MTKRLLSLLYIAIGLTTAATLGTALASELLTRRQEHDILAGLAHPLLGLDHFLALIVVGVWAGRLRGLALQVMPVSLMAGMALGFLLAAPRPLAPVEPVIELAMLAASVALAWAALRPLRLPFTQSTAVLLLLGVLHGCTDRVEAGRAEEWLFVGGYIGTAATLLALGVMVGLVAPREPRSPLA
jgi:urease accessory protein